LCGTLPCCVHAQVMQMDYLTYCTRLLGQLGSAEIKKFIKMPPSGFKEEKKVGPGRDAPAVHHRLRSS
jgi:hypothetical protein